MQKKEPNAAAFFCTSAPAPARHRIFPTEDSPEHIARMDNIVRVIISLPEPGDSNSRHHDVELTEDSRMTLGEWLDRWLTEYKAGTVRPLKSYRCYIEYYIKPQLGDKQISLISLQDVQRMYCHLKTAGRVREYPELHAALKDAVQAYVIPRNPTEGTTTPKPNYKPKRILTRAELDAFHAVVEQDEAWRDFFQTELMTGLRRGEICGLQWSNFDGDAPGR